MNFTRTTSRGVASALLASLLVVGGSQTSAVTAVASDEGWTALGAGMAGIAPAWPGKRVFGIARAADGTLYAGGNFTDAGGVAGTANLAKWNGTQWTPVGSGLAGPVYTVALASNNDLWIGGDFSGRLARWDGTTFVTPTPALVNDGANDNGVEEIVVASSTEVYVGGKFAVTSQNNSNGFTRFDGTALVSVGDGVGGSFKIVNGMTAAPGGGVIIGGQFASVNGSATAANRVGQWNGTTWTSFGGATSGPLGGLVAAVAATSGGAVIIGGNFTKVQNSGTDVAETKGLARWNGTAWESIGTITGAVVEELRVIGDYLYVGGEFTAIGGVEAKNIARYNLITSTWEPLLDGCQNGVNGVVRSIIDTGLSDGSVYVGGGFTNAGLVPEADGIAKFTPNSRGCRFTGEYLPPITNLRMEGLEAYRVGSVSGTRVHLAWDVPAEAGYALFTVTTNGEMGPNGFVPTAAHANPTCETEAPVCSLFFPYTSNDRSMQNRQFHQVKYSVLGQSTLGIAQPVTIGPLTTTSLPSAPQNVQVRSNWRSVTVSWDRPATGTGYITNYLVMAGPHRRVCITTVLFAAESDSRTCTFQNLRQNVGYTYTVQALSTAGWGPASAASESVEHKDLKVASSKRSKIFLGASRIRVAGIASGYADGTALKTFMQIGTGAWQEITNAGVRVNGSGEFSFTRVISPFQFNRPVSVRFTVDDNAACSVKPMPRECGRTATVTMAPIK